MPIRCMSGLLAGLTASAALIACSGKTDRPKPIDSASTVVALGADTLASYGRLASDATLMIEATPALHTALRTAAESFASREAIRVVFVTSPADSADARVSSDLIVLTGADTTRLRIGSPGWTLPFAELDSTRQLLAALPADSATAISDPPMKPRAKSRTSKRKAADTDTAPKRSPQDSARLARARLLLVTIPADAPNSAVAERFVRYLLGDGRATLLQAGLHVLPRLEVHGHGAPPGIASLADTVIPGDSSRTPEPTPER
jgi:hypothetical protein